ncbi:MAG: tetratricopeptide repeat protein [Reyranella sp.]|uniref:tetratricopeptide repeat protein n=1 Tax=Reyranella sp. TaxID=1929291 RepID=UPI001ACF40AD|nr:tetratricopeptide repeat protein [Reyranella sp.]MBN9086865.1 tetratricopeptide repeat protein [Reyranella sp.]
MRSALCFSVASCVLGFSIAAFAAGGGGGGIDSTPAKPVDPAFGQARALIEAKNYAAAMPLLQQVAAKDPRNADAYTLMGYATRKSGNPNGSLQYYNQALTLDPKHIGAHEYVGEAYLMLDRLPEAEQHLARLDSLCLFGCTEYRMLKTAIANYKAGRKPTN